MRLACLSFGIAFTIGSSALAQEDLTQRYIDALALENVFDILHEEGLEAGQELALEDQQFRPSPAWSLRLEQIYSTRDMAELFRAGLRDIPDLDASLPALEFFESSLGQKIVRIEIEARRAISSNEVEEAISSRVDEMAAENDSRLELYDAFIEANDLVDSNVSGALNANLAFYQGMATHPQFAATMDDAFMTSSVWEQEPEIRAEMETWVMNFSALAYSALDDEEMQAYIDMSLSPAGQKLNAALFSGFDTVFEAQSFELGRATAEFSLGEDT